MTDRTSQRVWMTLGAAIWRFRRRTLAAIGLVVLAKLSAVAVPMALKQIVDQFSAQNVALTLPVFLLLGYAILRFFGTLFGELRDVIFARVVQTTVADFLVRAFTHLHDLGPRFHNQRQTGALTRDVERGTTGIGFLLGVALFTIVPTLIEMASVVVILAVAYSYLFTVIMVITFVVYAVFTVVFTQRRAVFQRAMNRLDSNANGRLVDSLLNYESVKFYVGETGEMERFRSIMNHWARTGVMNQRALSTLHIGQSAIIAVSVATIMLLAGQYVVRGSMTVGDLVLINAYVLQICLPLNSLGFIFREAKDATINAERLFGLLDQRPDVVEQAGTPALRVRAGHVRFENVVFAYEPDRPILHDVSFTIPAGKTVAVVGGSGSGKSTLARLLFRFYDVGAGRITIDEQDVRSVSQASLRRAIGIVPQDTLLFNDTIGYNIAYGRPGASMAEVIDAARAAQIDELIRTLPQQYDTLVGERGVKLSGGERQRIAIARAILKNPPILVFDEATAALDTRSERAIQDELNRLAKNRSSLLIAHRLSTVVDADEILVMEHGYIVERGTHDALLAQSGVYAQMWRLQQQQRDLEFTAQRLARQPLNLTSLVADVIDGLRGSIEERGIKLYTSIAPEAMRITGDLTALHKAIWDAMAHMIDAVGQAGSMELHLQRQGANALLTLEGAVRERLPSAEGAAAKPVFDVVDAEDLLARNGGRFSVTRDDTLMRMVFEVPLRAVAPASIQTASHVPGLSGVTVACIDDDDEARQLLGEVLIPEGIEVRPFASGRAALAWLAATPAEQWPQALLCDISLADGEDGYEVIGQVRELEEQRQVPPGRRLPAIALTGLASSRDRMRALLAGFQLHMAKPVAPQELLAGIASLVSQPARRATDA
ncbi:ATP-binding cassette domain-containing protein [Uliginosibacterium sp. sgz301328]|uniref:ATP-binding cassette domain-containing protein n=1 Tax=Uliginosibacterium sp. sgz301328 TaxID=3243764 RepID=UPI00359D6FE4